MRRSENVPSESYAQDEKEGLDAAEKDRNAGAFFLLPMVSDLFGGSIRRIQKPGWANL
jgi:hypothetical protein